MNTLISLKIGPMPYVPFDNYPRDFTFIVNKEEYHTNKLIADILSKKISQIHLTDPTVDQYEVFTDHPGNFQPILDLLKVDNLNINSSELPFLAEITKTLDIDINFGYNQSHQITLDNVIELIQTHEKYGKFFSNFLREEIEFASKNFYELKDTNEDSLLSLSTSTIQSIISNENLCLNSEDQLLDFVNKLYVSDNGLSGFYEFVDFTNVSGEMIGQFSSAFNVDDITRGTWNNILTSLHINAKTTNNSRHKISSDVGQGRYVNVTKHASSSFKGAVFKGIFNQLRQNNKINSLVKVSFSSDGCGFDVRKIVQSNNSDFSFSTRDIANSWLCFKFIKCQVSVTHYTIRTDKWNDTGGNHPRSWVIEGLNGNQWEVIDERENVESLNGAGQIGTFDVNRNTNRPYNSIRMRQTDTNWNNKNYLMINAIEFYGNILM